MTNLDNKIREFFHTGIERVFLLGAAAIPVMAVIFIAIMWLMLRFND